MGTQMDSYTAPQTEALFETLNTECQKKMTVFFETSRIKGIGLKGASLIFKCTQTSILCLNAS